MIYENVNFTNRELVIKLKLKITGDYILLLKKLKLLFTQKDHFNELENKCLTMIT